MTPKSEKFLTNLSPESAILILSLFMLKLMFREKGKTFPPIQLVLTSEKEVTKDQTQTPSPSLL